MRLESINCPCAELRHEVEWFKIKIVASILMRQIKAGVGVGRMIAGLHGRREESPSSTGQDGR